MRSILATTLLLSFTYACSTEAPAAPSNDAGDASIEPATQDAQASSVDGGTDAASDAAVEPDTGNVGRVFAISDTTIADGGTRASYRAGAYFVHVTGTDTSITTRTAGPCVVETMTGGSTTQETELSAGAVHISGGSQKIDLVPAGATYNAVSGKTALWNGGETLTITADGKDVPAFSTSLTAPSKLTLTAPALPSTPNGALVITRNADLAATWTGSSTGQMVLYFDATTSTSAFATTCTFNASDGKGSVPAAAFSDYPKGGGTFNFYVKQTATAVAKGWSIKFTASSAVVSPQGAAATGSVDFK